MNRTIKVAALAGLAAALCALAPSDAQQPKGAAPPAVAFVSPQTPFVLHLRARELWDSEPLKFVRAHLPEIVADLERGLFKDMKPEDVESMTFILPGVPELGRGIGGDGPAKKVGDRKPETPTTDPKECAPQDRRPDQKEDPEPKGPVIVVTLHQAEAADQLRKQLEAGGQEHDFGGKKYYTNPNKGDEAFYFPAARTVVTGPAALVKAGIARGGKPAKGALPEAVASALAEKHQLVAAVGPAALDGLFGGGGRDPGQRLFRRLLTPLKSMHAGVLTLDLAKKSRAGLSIHFADAKAAEKALPAVQDLLVVVRLFLIGELMGKLEERADEARDATEEEKAVLAVMCLERLEDALRSAKAEVRGNAVRAACAADTDFNPLVAKAKAVVKARQGDEGQKLKRTKMLSMHNLKQIGLALHNYEAANRQLPPAAVLSKDGKPLLSWRVLILPYIEQGPLYNQFKLDEPWDSAHNKKLLESMPTIYAPVGVKTKEPHATFYRGFVGKGAGWEVRPAPMVQLGASGLRFADFQDGTSNVLLLVEAGEAVPWTKPDDLPYDDKKPLPKLGGLFKDGYHLLMADGFVRFVRPLEEQLLRLLITRADGMPIPDLDKQK